MMKQYLGHVLASSLVLAGAAEVYAADANLPPSTTRIQRSFVNLDIQKPVISSSWTYLDADPALIGTAMYVPGWRTTHSQSSNNKYPVEFWKGPGATGIADNPNRPSTTSYADNQYAELNAMESSNIYQTVCLVPDDEFSWSFDHATRDKKEETAEFFLGQLSGRSTWNGKIPLGLSPVHSTVRTWATQTSVAKVNMAAYITQAANYSFVFQAKVAGATASQGNFIDNVKINLKPAVEFSTQNGNYVENNSSSQSVPFKLVGQILSAADMPELEFKIQYDAGIPLAQRAIYGTDYVLARRSSASTVIITPDTNDGKGNITFKYRPTYNSGLDYAQGVLIQDLVIQLTDNKNIEGDKTLPLAFALTKNSGAVTTNMESCGGSNPLYSFNLTLKDDDTDLEVIKTLTAGSIPQPGNYISYTVELNNKTIVDAQNVILKDVLGKNLQTVNGITELLCEDVTAAGAPAVCPASWTAAGKLADLTGSGLNLTGGVEKNKKYKFTVKNLQVKSSDQETGGDAGHIINTATVTSTTDQNLANNTSAVRTLYAAKNDLSNNKAGAPASETGVGMFNIAQEGRTGATPLWTKTADSSGKAYFPLNIQNYGNLAQDYQLYASSTAIAPAVSSGDYSSLVKSGISPFTSGLKVEFYQADAGQCKAGISSQQISQLNVAANATGQVCAVVTAYASASAKTNIWFAIESLQSGLGDIILDAVIPQPKQRLLELANDQSAQVAVGGTYVFLHRITNYGIEDEKVSRLSLTLPNDGFLYSLFLDKNKSDALDAGDTLLVTGTEADVTGFIIQPNQSMTLFIKVEAPATAANGMSSQVKLIAVPNNAGKEIALADLSNTDLISVSPNQLQILKSQLPVASCSMTNAQAVISAAYTVQNASLKPDQCLIYRIMVKNSGSATLSNVTINDMYPAYTKQWAPANILPIIGSNGQNVTDGVNNKIEDDGSAKIKAILKELLPQQEKSLYFGIKMQ
ncbi:hypothetical protein BEN74_10650 [Acinetobacter sp. WCHAc010034]|uniref:DUF11 domain-containing protein n=1 Tax=Acinetobacter sp. WCHAc010034 TaxID=1879049 RepID=UPI000839D902|nr:DUF11 domain-containing protein [Acinetobacter sp. WCHAc010034]AYA03248.1 hypothetical protein BEN74_10650 [Acinetobacter sp. WCHAc010034]